MKQNKYTSLGCMGALLAVLSAGMLPASGQVVTPGGKFPNVTAPLVLNHPSDTLSLTQFRDQAVILQFIDTRCSATPKTMVLVDSLQKTFGQEVQFLLITQQSRKVVAEFIKMKKITLPSVPLVVEDTAFSRHLPATHTVWLDRSRVLRYITGSYNLTDNHIRKFLSGEPLAMKYSAIKARSGSLMQQPAGYDGTQLYYSYLTPCLEGIDIGRADGRLVNGGRSVKVAAGCRSVLELFQQAFGEGGKYPVYTRYGLELQVRDSVPYFEPEDPGEWDAWRASHTYNYELVLPAEKKDRLYPTMQQDLLRLFNLQAERVAKKVTGYKLVAIHPVATLQTKGGKPMDAYNDGRTAEPILVFRNRPMERLIELLRLYVSNHYPLVTDSIYTGNIDFGFRKDSLGPLHIPKLRDDLRRSGLDLVETEVDVAVLVIKEK